MSMRGALHDKGGRRLYLTPNERRRFLLAATGRTSKERLLCETLAHAGLRISEALSMSDDSLDIELSALVVESLKKRKRGVFRTVPVHRDFLSELRAHAGAFDRRDGELVLLWPWCRTTAYYLIKDVMHEAAIQGPQATPKGLRHGFAINALACGVPLNMIQKWMGHSSIEITSIYLNAIGDEERVLAEKMWTADLSGPGSAQMAIPISG